MKLGELLSHAHGPREHERPRALGIPPVRLDGVAGEVRAQARGRLVHPARHQVPGAEELRVARRHDDGGEQVPQRAPVLALGGRREPEGAGLGVARGELCPVLRHVVVRLVEDDQPRGGPVVPGEQGLHGGDLHGGVRLELGARGDVAHGVVPEDLAEALPRLAHEPGSVSHPEHRLAVVPGGLDEREPITVLPEPVGATRQTAR